MKKLICIISLLIIQSSAWAKLDKCSGKYSFSSPTSGKTIKCSTASHCAKKHARASSYWQRLDDGEKEKFIVSLQRVTHAYGFSIDYKSINKQYLNGELISKHASLDSFMVRCKSDG